MKDKCHTLEQNNILAEVIFIYDVAVENLGGKYMY